MPRHRSALWVDELGRRDAPATLVSPYMVTYQDPNGDNVVVNFSRPILTRANVGSVFAFDTGSVSGSNSTTQQLRSISLAGLGTAVAGTGITVTAMRTALHRGDGFAAVGQIDATGIDLGLVKVDGDLGRILAGDADAATGGLKGLTVLSLGQSGTGSGAPDLTTTVQGRLGFLTVRRNVQDASVRVEGGADGRLGRVFIGGSLIGGDRSFSGQIDSTGDMGFVTISGYLIGGRGIAAGEITAGANLAGVRIGGSAHAGGGFASARILSTGDMGFVTIRGNLIGSAGDESGQVSAGRSLAGVTVGGSVLGGDGLDSGRIADGQNVPLTTAEDLGVVTIRGDLTGGNGKLSGYVHSNGKLAGVTVGGSVRGGSGWFSGRIDAFGDAGVVAIGGDLVGGSANGTQVPFASGMVYASRIARFVLGGSLIAGSEATTQSLPFCGAILVGNDLGSVLIKGSVIGTSTNPAQIIARGQETPTPTRDVAIGGLTVLGRVEYGHILAGIDENFVGKTDADAQIGNVRVGGDWIASTLAAGADFGYDGYFGTDDDTKLSSLPLKDDSFVVSTIASVTIGGHVAGTAAAGDHFGIVAEVVGAVTVGGKRVPLRPGPHNDDVPLGSTGDFSLRELTEF
jgi:hypothetical protein